MFWLSDSLRRWSSAGRIRMPSSGIQSATCRCPTTAWCWGTLRSHWRRARAGEGCDDCGGRPAFHCEKPAFPDHLHGIGDPTRASPGIPAIKKADRCPARSPVPGNQTPGLHSRFRNYGTQAAESAGSSGWVMLRFQRRLFRLLIPRFSPSPEGLRTKFGGAGRDLTNHLVIMGFGQFPEGKAAAFARLA